MYVKSIEEEMDKNGCSYFVSSLGPIEGVSRTLSLKLKDEDRGRISRVDSSWVSSNWNTINMIKYNYDDTDVEKVRK